MNYINTKLYIEYNSIKFTRSAINDKFLSFLVLCENDNTLSSINNIKFDGNPIKYYIVPNSLAPFRTYMNMDYKNNIKQSGFFPIKSELIDIKKFNNKHLYIDSNKYFDVLIDRMNLNIFNNKKYISYFNNYLNAICNSISNNFEKNLLYTINIDNDFSEKLLNRKILPLYLAMLNDEKISFNKIFVVYYSPKNNTKEYNLIYDSNKKSNPSRVRQILLKYKPNTIKDDTNDVDETVFDFEEDDIKKASDFKESSFSSWKNGIDNYILNELNPITVAKGLVALKRAAVATRGRGLVTAGRSALKTGNTLSRSQKLLAKGKKFVGKQMIGASKSPIGYALGATTLTGLPTAATIATQGLDKVTNTAADGAAKVIGAITGKQPSYLTPQQRLVSKRAGQAALATGALAAGYGAYKAAKQNRLDKMYSSGCEGLQGTALTNCIKQINMLKIENLQKMLSTCNGNPDCITRLNNEIKHIQNAMSQNRIAE